MRKRKGKKGGSARVRRKEVEDRTSRKEEREKRKGQGGRERTRMMRNGKKKEYKVK